MGRTAELTLRVHLDEAALPQRIEWGGSEVGFDGLRACTAANLTLWDGESHQLCGLGLWTPETRLEDMQTYLCQSLTQLADTCRRATRDETLAGLIEDCAKKLAARLALQMPPGSVA